MALLVRKITVLEIQACFQASNEKSKGSEFETHHYHTVGKESTVKDLNKTESDSIF